MESCEVGQEVFVGGIRGHVVAVSRTADEERCTIRLERSRRLLHLPPSQICSSPPRVGGRSFEYNEGTELWEEVENE